MCERAWICAKRRGYISDCVLNFAVDHLPLSVPRTESIRRGVLLGSGYQIVSHKTSPVHSPSSPLDPVCCRPYPYFAFVPSFCPDPTTESQCLRQTAAAIKNQDLQSLKVDLGTAGPNPAVLHPFGGNLSWTTA